MRRGLGVVAQKGLAGMGGGQSFWGFISLPSPPACWEQNTHGYPTRGMLKLALRGSQGSTVSLC